VIRRPATLLVCLALVAGCGGGDDDEAAPKTPDIGGVREEPVQPTGDPEAGKVVFAKSGCGGCHVLEAAGSRGTTGPNLDETKPDFSRIVDQVRDGGNGMPAFRDKLSEKEILDVSQFVADAVQQ
jgi:cytochrome c6